MTPLDAAWEAVLVAPDDDRALLVLADALMEVGDPHGELIRLQLSGADDEPHLTQHAEALFGDPIRLATWSPRFARGFLTEVSIGVSSELEAVLARPIGRLLRKVDISALTMEPIDQLGELLATRGPKTLGALWFGRGGLSPWAPPEVTLDVEHPGLLKVAALTARLPSLTELVLSSWAVAFEGASSQSLRSLELNLQPPVSGLGEARFPGLRSLGLELPFRRLDLPAPLLAGEVAPALESLSLSGALWPQQLTELSRSVLLRGLRRLELTAEAETGWYPTLLETLDSFAHLEELVLIADRHHPEWVAAVKAALPRAQIRDPRLRL